jgi:ABC-type multidrug transport system permease subunit
MMMSGLFTSAESMPDWAQTANILNPIAYFMRLVRTILLKGSGLADIAAMSSVCLFSELRCFRWLLRATGKRRKSFFTTNEHEYFRKA